jgi:RNase adapter protein RapZ
MNLVIISGLSGSGKTIALHTLEDVGYYCTDNLPVGLLDAFVLEFSQPHLARVKKVAVGIDARSSPKQLGRFPSIIASCRRGGINCRIIFLQADDEALLKRFSETRRKHPLTGPITSLADAIRDERALLAPISANADLFLDTSQTNVHQLRELMRDCVGGGERPGLTLLFRSFGYKQGIPLDADFVFDSRCLPNPYWKPALRNLTGRDREVIEFLDGEAAVHELYADLENFLLKWIPRFEADNRSYLSVAIGCTGGQHRSVYLVERIAGSLGHRFGSIVIRHRELA